MDSLPTTPAPVALRPQGITLNQPRAADRAAELLARHGLADQIMLRPQAGRCRLALRPDCAEALAPAADTLRLAERLPPVPDADALTRETLVALLASPHEIAFPSAEEFESALRIRRHIAAAAARTQLAFDTEAVERPEDCWCYAEERGFTLRPGCSLIDALTKATQPDASGRRYAFSCYRATEYVILLGLAQELADSNPELLQRLQKRWERKAIMSGAFHEAFLLEHGSLEQPVPGRYYVPGDRVWFRNPDERSADVAGYEGSWVIYLGGGLFSNFWQPGAPFTLERKCVEIYHWRHGVRADARGDLQMDERLVAAHVAQTLADPQATRTVLARMGRLRDPRGVYAQGGCLDASRESTRCVRPQTADLRLEV